jgi:adenosylcobinamide hydrolase
MATGEGGWTTAVAGGVCRLARQGGPVRWLSTGVDGGSRQAPAAYNVTVPEGFDRTDPGAYAVERRRAAGFDGSGPALLTGVEQTHAVGARLAPVTVVATVGLSNPARLPVDAGDGRIRHDAGDESRADAAVGVPEDPGADADADTEDVHPDSTASPDGTDAGRESDGARLGGGTSGTAPGDRGSGASGGGRADAPDGWDRVGTVNLLVGTDRALDEGVLASLLATVVEAKAATLVPSTGFSGTTSDAVVVGTDPEGEPAAFAGSATPVGAAARACVRTAVVGGLQSRYAETAVPESVAAAEHGVVTDERARAFEP